MTVTAPARPERHRSLPATLRVAVALMAAVTVLVVGLAGLFASSASARTLRRPETRVGAFGPAGGQMVGAHEPVLAGQRRARAPTYDQTAVGSCVAAETEPALADQAAAACGGMSFTATTRVLLADGSSMQISQLKVADKVLATDTSTGKSQAEPVTAVLVHQDINLYDLTIQSGSTTAVIHTTSSHLFWDQTTHTWTQAAKLDPGDHLQTPGVTTARVVIGATAAITNGTMWDLTVANDHDFYVSVSAESQTAVLVHNCAQASQGQPFDENQQAVVQLAKTAARTGISPDDFSTLSDWADEYGLSSRGPEIHPDGDGWASQNWHGHIGPVNHIPITGLP